MAEARVAHELQLRLSSEEERRVVGWAFYHAKHCKETQFYLTPLEREILSAILDTVNNALDDAGVED